MKGEHINADGKFQSDKYPACPAGKVPLSITDPTAQDLLWEYAQRRRAIDEDFSADVETCLLAAGYEPQIRPDRRDIIAGTIDVGYNEKREVVIGLPEDAVKSFSETGHIVFSPNQARGFAHTLFRKAHEAECHHNPETTSRRPQP